MGVIWSKRKLLSQRGGVRGGMFPAAAAAAPAAPAAPTPPEPQDGAVPSVPPFSVSYEDEVVSAATVAAIPMVTDVLRRCIPDLEIERAVEALSYACGKRYARVPGGSDKFCTQLDSAVSCLVCDTPKESIVDVLCGLFPTKADLNNEIYVNLMNSLSMGATPLTGEVPRQFIEYYGQMSPDDKQSVFMRIAYGSRWSTPDRWEKPLGIETFTVGLLPMVFAFRVEADRSNVDAATFLQDYGSKCPAAIYIMAQDQALGELLSRAMAAMRPEKLCEMFRTVSYYISMAPLGSINNRVIGTYITRDNFPEHVLLPLLAALERDQATQSVTDSLFQSLSGGAACRRPARLSIGALSRAFMRLESITPERKVAIEDLAKSVTAQP